MRRDARLLKGKALASLRRCARTFNDFDDDGRVTTVLLHLQHSFEMLLKACLVEKNTAVFDRRKSGEPPLTEETGRTEAGRKRFHKPFGLLYVV